MAGSLTGKQEDDAQRMTHMSIVDSAKLNACVPGYIHIEEAQVVRFAALFRGLTRAYGTYTIGPAVAAGEKRVGQAVTHATSVTLAHYRAHLQKKTGLGIVPIDERDQCWFAAIDVDKYGVDFADLYAKINALKIPFVPCRSKS